MLCQKCGIEIGEWEVCPHCGNIQVFDTEPIPAPQPVSQPIPQPAPVTVNDAPVKKPSKAKIILPILGILLALPAIFADFSILENGIKIINRFMSRFDGDLIRAAHYLDVSFGIYDHSVDASDLFNILDHTGALHLLYSLAVLLGFILLLLRKPKAAVIVPLMGIFSSLYVLIRYIVYASQGETEWLFYLKVTCRYLGTDIVPLLVLSILALLAMAIFMLTGKFKQGTLVPILPEAIFLISQIVAAAQDYSYFVRRNRTIGFLEFFITYLFNDFASATLCAAVILFCICYVLTVGSRNAANHPIYQKVIIKEALSHAMQKMRPKHR